MATFKACIGPDGVLHDIEVQIIAWPIDLFQNYFWEKIKKALCKFWYLTGH